MSRPVRKTVSSATASAPIPMDIYCNANISVSVVLAPASTLTYTVQHTFDDVFAAGFSSATATWFDNDALTGKTANEDGNYASPVTAIRLNVTAYTAGSATITVIQSGYRS